ncbi:MAG: protein-S-isoprenylcysteine O-methyltransferase [Pseudomonadota bacterium]
MNQALRWIGPLIGLVVAAIIVSRWHINGLGSLVWLGMAIGISVIRAPFAKRSAANTIIDQRATGIERVLLAMVAIGGTILPAIHLATGVLGFANYTLPAWTAALAVLLLIPTLWLFWRSHADLGRNWSVTTELREEQTLVTSGVYTRIRHPMYAAIWLFFLLQPLVVHNWIAGFVGPIAFAVLYFVRVPYEEAMMRDCFADEYIEYCRQTGRVLPKMSK